MKKIKAPTKHTSLINKKSIHIRYQLIVPDCQSKSGSNNTVSFSCCCHFFFFFIFFRTVRQLNILCLSFSVVYRDISYQQWKLRWWWARNPRYHWRMLSYPWQAASCYLCCRTATSAWCSLATRVLSAMERDPRGDATSSSKSKSVPSNCPNRSPFFF